MLDPQWVFLGAALGLVGSVHYAYSTIRGTTRPNLVTWSLWAFAPLVAFFAQLDAGVGLPAVMTLAAGLGPLLVVVTGLISRHNRAAVGPFDFVCAGVALAAIGAWIGWEQAELGILLAIAADAVAVLPTAVKAWRRPDSENPLFYWLVAAGAGVTLTTVTAADVPSLAFVVYQLVACLALVAVVSVRTVRVPSLES